MASVRRVGIIGDVHAEDKALEAVLRFLLSYRYHALDALLCTGDLVTGQGDAARAITLLRDAGAFVVRGNHDRWFVWDSPRQRGVGYDTLEFATPDEEVSGLTRDFLTALPVTLPFSTPAGPLLLCHGTGTDDMAGVYPNDPDEALAANHALHRLWAERHYRFLVAGHTHRRMLRPLDHLTVINPGTLKRDPRVSNGFLIADFEAGRLCVYDLDPKTLTITAAGSHDLPGG